jgi:hypothetical protein
MVLAANEQRRALLVYVFEIVSTCVDEAPPPLFKVRWTLATVSACSLALQAQTGED